MVLRLTLYLLVTLTASGSPQTYQHSGRHPKKEPGTALEGRFNDLSCAIVQVATIGQAGTVFFDNANGEIITAAHVVFKRSYFTKGNKVQMTVQPRSRISIRDANGDVETTTLKPDSNDWNLALYDLAVVRSSLKPPCLIPRGDVSRTRVGEHLVSIGYPVLTPAPVLYEGFISSIHPWPKAVPVGYAGSRPVVPPITVFRIQMPITAGDLGAPLVNDENQAVAVVTDQGGVWAADLEQLNEGMTQLPNGTGVLIRGFDIARILNDLSMIVRNFDGSGSCLAVPVSYLEAPKPGDSVR